jgi:glutaredoxin-dependent peroxiredoxin
MALPVGASAPDFTLKTLDTEGLRDVSLSSHQGDSNVVLLFFPGAFTSVCTQEVCDVTSDLARFQTSNAKVYGVSNDTPFVLQAWAKQLKVGFPLLSDFQHEVARAFDVVWPDFAGLGPGTARAAIVIDKQGAIRYSEQTATLGGLPDFEALHAVLAKLP